MSRSIPRVQQSRYSGWNSYPVYECNTYNDFTIIGNWCYHNQVETFLLASGAGKYIFQVRKNHEWFVLKWL